MECFLLFTSNRLAYIIHGYKEDTYKVLIQLDQFKLVRTAGFRVSTVTENLEISGNVNVFFWPEKVFVEIQAFQL